MNVTQKIVFSMMMVLLIGILVLQHKLADNFSVMGIVLFMVISSLVVGSLFAPRPTRTHKIIGIAIFFIFIGDIFLVFSKTIPGVPKDALLSTVLGMLGFLCAYAMLIRLFTRHFSLGIKDMIMMVPVLAVLIPVLITLVPRIEGIFRYFAIFFGLFVGFMAWNALCTIHRKYFNKNVALRFAVAGFFMFLSDMGVAFVLFYPGMMTNAPWLENEIWITYVPAWTLVFVNLLEEKLLKE